MNTHFKNGLAGGLCLAFFHLCWIVLVALEWGQGFLDFIFKIHMLSLSVQVQPFNIGYAAALLGVTFSVGFVIGIVLGVFADALKPSNPKSDH